MSDNLYTTGLLGKLKFPKGITISLLGVTVFLIGDGIESVWITDFAHSTLGYELSVAALLLTCYGVVVAVGSFLSMALSDAIGPRNVMLIGLISFLVFDVLFITVGIPSGNLPLLLVIYSCRGLGYPFYAMGFFAWLMKKSRPEEQSPITGWFFFFFSLGIQILGSYVSSILLPSVGPIATLWSGLAMSVIGGAACLAFMRGPGVTLSREERNPIGMTIIKSLSIIYRRPKIGLSGLIGAINLVGPLALSSFYITYLITDIKLDQGSAVLVFTIFGIFAVLGNVIWGNIGNAVGWVNSVRFFAGPLCAAALLYFYYIPMLVGPNFWAIAFGGVIMGMGVSAFVPLNAVFVAHSGGEVGSALAVNGLARGAASFIGPALAAALLQIGGYAAVVWVVAGLYLSILVIGIFIKLPGNAKILESAEPGATGAAVD
ncbi:MAG: MFS transporter [Propionibacteriaceae bacterium]|jgi:predicted MFS family arabinose efflux permease|nr:MFS transporter [Propionibacteriaceae bacterium]